MGKKYRHLGLKERETISQMKRDGHVLQEIALRWSVPKAYYQGSLEDTSNMARISVR